MSTPNPKWFSVSRPVPAAKLRLFCFPYSGAGASVYRTWGSDLPADVEVCAIQPPGRESRFREPFLSSAPAIVDELCASILPHLDRPFAFFGHSLGALISFELARALSSRINRPPRALLVSGRRGPRAIHLADPTVLHQLSDTALEEAVVRMNGMDPKIAEDRDLMSLLLPILRADFSISETHSYSPGPPLSCPILAFGGDSDEGVTPRQLAAWRDETSAEFRMQVFSGGHFYLRSGWKEFASALSYELELLIRGEGPASTTLRHSGAGR